MEPTEVNERMLRGTDWQIQNKSTTYCMSSTAAPFLEHSYQARGPQSLGKWLS